VKGRDARIRVHVVWHGCVLDSAEKCEQLRFRQPAVQGLDERSTGTFVVADNRVLREPLEDRLQFTGEVLRWVFAVGRETSSPKSRSKAVCDSQAHKERGLGRILCS